MRLVMKFHPAFTDVASSHGSGMEVWTTHRGPQGAVGRLTRRSTMRTRLGRAWGSGLPHSWLLPGCWWRRARSHRTVGSGRCGSGRRGTWCRGAGRRRHPGRLLRQRGGPDGRRAEVRAERHHQPGRPALVQRGMDRAAGYRRGPRQPGQRDPPVQRRVAREEPQRRRRRRLEPRARLGQVARRLRHVDRPGHRPAPPAPEDVQVNSIRGNKDFDNGGSEVSGAPGNFTDTTPSSPATRSRATSRA